MNTGGMTCRMICTILVESSKSLESDCQTLRVYNSFAMFDNVHLTNISLHLNNLNGFGVRSVWQFRKYIAAHWGGAMQRNGVADNILQNRLYINEDRHGTKSNDNNWIYSKTYWCGWSVETCSCTTFSSWLLTDECLFVSFISEI